MEIEDLKGVRQNLKNILSNLDENINSLYDLATKDEKTGLYNSKFFETMLTMEIDKARRGKQKLSLVIIDIDFFKKINDTYGHIKADELLNKLAKVLQKQTRKSDILARFGGEEFIILLPETSLLKAKKFASRLKKAVHSDKILAKYNLTISGGIAEYKKRDSETKLKHRADKALSKAQKLGRERFIAI